MPDDGFLRDSADAQLKIHDMMTRELTTPGLPFAQVKGGGNLRLDEESAPLTRSSLANTRGRWVKFGLPVHIRESPT